MKTNRKLITSLLALTLAYSSVLTASVNETYAYEERLSYFNIRGDLDFDDELTSSDVKSYYDILSGRDESGTDINISDINGDNIANISDLIRLKAAVLGNAKIWSYKNIPAMDGSTSAIPLEAGIKSELLGIPYFDAKNSVNHHKTHESFQMLLSGDIDMIFTVPISESQQQAADAAGVHLTQIPVAKEGFVFVVNKDNPVDSLTQQQIKDIYSGKITNWSEVGGNDEPVIPYQRNNDSGSQNYMVDFMKDSDLMTPPLSYRIGTMGMLMDAVAVYDNSSQAIGYSVYSYAAQMYENSSSVKFIAVDGVRPSRESMADDTYPLLSNTYIMYTDNVSEDTLDFTEWAVSEEGQQCVLEHGYIPVEKMEYPESLKPYSAAGTGKEKAADYTPDKKYSVYYDRTFYSETEPFRLHSLKDKETEAKINSDIAEALRKIPGADSVSVQAVNGYMSIAVRKSGRQYHIPQDIRITQAYSDVITLNYNLRTGEKIEKFSDYFYKGTEFTEIINNNISDIMNGNMAPLGKADFLGLSGNIENFTLSSVYSGKNNYYSTDNFEINYDSYYTPDVMITGEYYDMKDLFTADSDVEDVLYNEWNYSYTGVGNNNFIQTLEGSRFHSEEEISRKKKIYNRISETLKEKLSESGDSHFTYEITEPDKTKDLNVIVARIKNIFLYYNFNSLMFDPETGEPVSISDIFGKSAEKYNDKKVVIDHITPYDDELTVKFVIENPENENGFDELFISFDYDDVNMKYININRSDD